MLNGSHTGICILVGHVTARKSAIDHRIQAGEEAVGRVQKTVVFLRCKILV